MLLGGGTLLVLAILCAAFLWSIFKTNSEKTFKLADDDYHAGSYAQAINKYREFVKNFPKDDSASLAKVRIGLAQLRELTQQGSNWKESAAQVDAILDNIYQEKDVKEAYDDVASMLAIIAEGLADDAGKKSDQTLVNEAYRILKILDNPQRAKNFPARGQDQGSDRQTGADRPQYHPRRRAQQEHRLHANGGEAIEHRGRLHRLQGLASPIS